MTDHDDDHDDERQALADEDEPAESETENAAASNALKARIVIRGLLDEAQGAISRTRTPGMARVEAAGHVQIALAYLGGPHLGLAAIHAAWAASYLDVAAKRSKLPAAIAARWVEVRDALPEAFRESMGDRSWASSATAKRKQRAARPTALGAPAAHRQGA